MEMEPDASPLMQRAVAYWVDRLYREGTGVVNPSSIPSASAAPEVQVNDMAADDGMTSDASEDSVFQLLPPSFGAPS